jgi:hypothetical protein
VIGVDNGVARKEITMSARIRNNIAAMF